MLCHKDGPTDLPPSALNGDDSSTLLAAACRGTDTTENPGRGLSPTLDTGPVFTCFVTGDHAYPLVTRSTSYS
jgi:hypothetical protein